jgi:large-conductance mechanosensitive channel
MSTFIITLIAVVLFTVAIFAIVSAATRKRQRVPREKLDQDYTYRKEPHADQVAEKPNKLKNNKVTKG